MDALLHPGAFVVLLMEQTLRHRGAEAIFQLESVRLAASEFLPINSSISLHLFLDKSVLANGHCRRRKIILSATLQRIVAIISFEYIKHYRKRVLVIYLLLLQILSIFRYRFSIKLSYLNAVKIVSILLVCSFY